jgi:hypothetical protein
MKASLAALCFSFLLELCSVSTSMALEECLSETRVREGEVWSVTISNRCPRKINVKLCWPNRFCDVVEVPAKDEYGYMSNQPARWAPTTERARRPGTQGLR